MTKEKWRPILQYEDSYEVSNFGRVRSLEREVMVGHRSGSKIPALYKARILKPRAHTQGYVTYTLRKDGWSTNHYGHRIVALAFCNLKDLNKTCVNHKNGVRTDNRSVNLEWVSYKENTNHGVVHGGIKRASNGKFA